VLDDACGSCLVFGVGVGEGGSLHALGGDGDRQLLPPGDVEEAGVGGRHVGTAAEHGGGVDGGGDLRPAAPSGGGTLLEQAGRETSGAISASSWRAPTTSAPSVRQPSISIPATTSSMPRSSSTTARCSASPPTPNRPNPTRPRGSTSSSSGGTRCWTRRSAPWPSTSDDPSSTAVRAGGRGVARRQRGLSAHRRVHAPRLHALLVDRPCRARVHLGTRGRAAAGCPPRQPARHHRSGARPPDLNLRADASPPTAAGCASGRLVSEDLRNDATLAAWWLVVRLSATPPAPHSP